MTSAEQVIESIEAAGGLLIVSGDRIRCRLPEDAAHLLEGLKAHKSEVMTFLIKRDIPPMPEGVRLVSWEPRPAPVLLTTESVVTDVDKFIHATLKELDTEIQWEPDTPILRATHARRLRDFTDKLEQVGVVIEVHGVGSASGGILR
jgi:hypothetical protein